MRGNLTRLLLNDGAVRALASAFPPATLERDRNFWITTALALTASSFGLSEPALAQTCTPVANPGNLTAAQPSTSCTGTFNTNINFGGPTTPPPPGLTVTLQPGVRVIIPAGSGPDAVNLANTTGPITTPGVDANLIVNDAFIDNTASSTNASRSGLRIQSSGDATIRATGTAINVAGGIGNNNGIWAIVLPSSDPTTEAKVGYTGPGITVTGGSSSTAIQAENRGNGNASIDAAGNFTVVNADPNGAFVWGLRASSDGGNASVDYHSGTIKVSGSLPIGIDATNQGAGSATVNAAGTINVSDPQFVGFPTGLQAVTSTGPILVTYNGPGITTEGQFGNGIFALSDSGNINVNSSGPINTTDGFNAVGILAESGGTGTVTVNATNVLTMGEFGTAINATGGGDVTVNIAQGGSVMGGWQADLDSVGPTFGLPAAGVVLSSTGGGTATLTNNGSIGALSDRAVQGDPVIINNGTMTGFVTLEGPSSYTNNGTFELRHFADTDGVGGRDTWRVAVSDLGGPNSTFTNNGTLALLGPPTGMLDPAGQYTPHGNALNAMAIGGPAQGQILGTTTFTNSGIIDLQANPAVGDVLLISGLPTSSELPVGSPGGGTFIANGGSLLLDTVLNNGAPSQSDVLVVDQVGLGAAGPTRILLNDAGAGDQTVGDGILVVEGLNNAATANVHPFGLGAPVVAGPYEYFLFRGGTGAGASDDWFLRSTFGPIAPEPPAEGGTPVPPVTAPPGTPIIRPEVSLFAAMPVMAEIYGRKIIDTLHERMGGDAQLLRPGKEDMPDGMWGRIMGYWGHRDGDAVGILGRDGPAFDYNFGAIQTGMDFYRNEYENGQRDNAGVYVAFGQGNADVEHNLFGRTFKGGEDDFNAVSVGGYWTRFGENNWYLDGVVQGTWYDMQMTGRRGLRDGETSGFGFAASLEGGYPFDLGNDWLLEPQAQLVYQNLNIDDFNDGVADVRYSDTDSLAGRIGARITRDWDVDGDPKRKFTLWGRADLWYEFLGDPTTEFSSARGFIPFTAELGDSWATLGIGAARQVSDSTTFYGNVNYDVSFNGDADAWEGKVGLKVQW